MYRVIPTKAKGHVARLKYTLNRMCCYATTPVCLLATSQARQPLTCRNVTICTLFAEVTGSNLNWFTKYAEVFY
jgi:hypothetical protein